MFLFFRMASCFKAMFVLKCGTVDMPICVDDSPSALSGFLSSIMLV